MEQRAAASVQPQGLAQKQDTDGIARGPIKLFGIARRRQNRADTESTPRRRAL